MKKLNCTGGPWTVDSKDPDKIEVVGTPAWGCERYGKRGRWTVATLDDLMGDYPKEVQANARLIAEAGTVLHETGLTPRQLAEQRAALLEALQAAKDALSNQRMFGVDTLSRWKQAAVGVEGDIEEAIALAQGDAA